MKHLKIVLLLVGVATNAFAQDGMGVENRIGFEISFSQNTPRGRSVASTLGPELKFHDFGEKNVQFFLINEPTDFGLLPASLQNHYPMVMLPRIQWETLAKYVNLEVEARKTSEKIVATNDTSLGHLLAMNESVISSLKSMNLLNQAMKTQLQALKTETKRLEASNERLEKAIKDERRFKLTRSIGIGVTGALVGFLGGVLATR